MFAESWLIAASTASIVLSQPVLPEGKVVDGRMAISSRPFVSVLAAQGGTYWLFPGQRDKTYHAMGCALISSLATEWTGSPWWGLAAGLTIGLAKEVLDYMVLPNGDPSFYLDGDLGADCLGTGMGTLLYFRF